MPTVAVFAFTHIDDDLNSDTHAPRKATREAIDRIGGTLIEASMEEVETSKVDGNGFYPKKGM